MNYKYVSYSTENKIVRGSFAASSEKAAAEALAGLGHRVLSLKPALKSERNWRTLFPSLFKVKADTILVFSRQLSTLLEAGINIIACLELLQAQTSDFMFREIIGKIISDVRAGTRLSDAMSKFPDIFPSIYWRSIGVGEQTGEMSNTLNQVSDYMEKSQKTKKGIKSALTYPIILSCLAIGVVMLLVNFVLPVFVGLYSTLGAQIPAMTRIFLFIIGGIRDYGVYGVLILAACLLGFLIYTRRSEGKLWWDGAKLRFPLLGRIVHLSELADCCRTMSVLFRCGVPLAEIMDVVTSNTRNLMIRQSLSNVKNSMLKGEGLSRPMSVDPFFLPMMVQMVKVGEESGGLDAALLTVAQAYDTEADSKTRAFVAVIQPALTVIIGAVVAFIVLSMVSVMYAVYGQMGNMG